MIEVSDPNRNSFCDGSKVQVLDRKDFKAPKPKPIGEPKPKPEPEPRQPKSRSQTGVYYRNCDAV